MISMLWIIELEYLNYISSLKKNFKIRGVISNAGQKDWLSFLSLSHQINDRTAGHSKKEVITEQYIPFKPSESLGVRPN